LASEYDVVVVGSGNGGMTAALAAAHRGLSTVIV
jgi:3-oxosteroid 1-dehydrogenase